MPERDMKALTQEEVVTELKKLGYSDVTERRITDWRQKGLLPAFDESGPGLGKSRGRRRSAWSEGEIVLKQAIWVYRLLDLFGNAEKLYIPLWMLGYDVSVSHVRKALNEPLSSAVREIDAATNTSGGLQDIIDDIAFEVSNKVRATNIEALQVPQEWLEACVSIFFVQDYAVWDAPFEYGVNALRGWQGLVEEQIASAFGKTLEDCPAVSDQHNGLLTSVDFAAFCNKSFSLRQIKSAVEACTDEVLRSVQQDMKMLVEIATFVWRITLILTRNLPAEFRPTEARALLLSFSLGRLLIWADISLRQSGFGDIIERLLNKLQSSLPKDMDEAELQLNNAQDFTPAISDLLAYLEGMAQSSQNEHQQSYYGVQIGTL